MKSHSGRICPTISHYASSKFHDCHILYDDSIGPGFIQFFQHLPCIFQFAVVDDRVEGYEDLRSESVRISAQSGYVIDVISRGLSCPEPRPCDIYGIGTAVDCRDADVSVPCGSKKFQLPHGFPLSGGLLLERLELLLRLGAVLLVGSYFLIVFDSLLLVACLLVEDSDGEGIGVYVPCLRH